MTKARSEDPVPYLVNPSTRAMDDEVIRRALVILQGRLTSPGQAISSPQDLKDFCVLHLASHEYEVFSLIFLTSQHAVIGFEAMFRGTLAQTSVYPREVVRAALERNAACVVLVHNHPSGMPEPSRADEHLTQVLKQALALIDVRVLDHIIVGGMSTVSFAERGLL